MIGIQGEDTKIPKKTVAHIEKVVAKAVEKFKDREQQRKDHQKTDDALKHVEDKKDKAEAKKAAKNSADKAKKAIEKAEDKKVKDE